MILVTGATGSVGREVVAQLGSRGHTVRAVVRDLGAARLPEGTEVVPGDLADPASIAAQVGDAGEDPGSSWGLAEDSVRQSGAGWTLLRPAGFAKNTLIWAPQIKAGDVVRWPYGRAGRSLIHEADIAAAAVAALTGDGHDQAVYSLTGPAVLTQAEQVEITTWRVFDRATVAAAYAD